MNDNQVLTRSRVVSNQRTGGYLLQLLTDAQTTMGSLFELRARHLGLTRPQWRVLAGLTGNNGMTQSELSEHISIARSPLGKIVDQLEKKGLVERHNDPDDRRINRLFLTANLELLVKPATELVEELEQSAIQGIAPGDLIEQLTQLTHRLRELKQAELNHSD